MKYMMIMLMALSIGCGNVDEEQEVDYTGCCIDHSIIAHRPSTNPAPVPTKPYSAMSDLEILESNLGMQECNDMSESIEVCIEDVGTCDGEEQYIGQNEDCMAYYEANPPTKESRIAECRDRIDYIEACIEKVRTCEDPYEYSSGCSEYSCSLVVQIRCKNWYYNQ